MARAQSTDIAHEQVTDHWIKKRIRDARLNKATTGELETVGGIRADDRDLGLAYAQMAERGDAAARTKAVELLRQAEQKENGARGDHELHTQLGFLEQVNGENEKAAAEYRLALQADAYDSSAAGDLALIEVGKRDFTEATELWRSVFDWNPALVAAGMNLVAVECAEGKDAQVLETLERILEFAPDDEKARELANAVRSGKKACKSK